MAPCRSCLVASNSQREPLVASILKLAPSSPDNMTSQAKTSSTAALVSVPSTASPAVATPQFITSLVQSTVQANTTSLLSQLDRRIAAALKAQGAVSNAPGREIQQSAQRQAPPPITSTPVAPVSTTLSQNVPGEHACGDSSVRYNICLELSPHVGINRSLDVNGSHSVCAVRTPLGIDRKILSIRREPMLSGFFSV